MEVSHQARKKNPTLPKVWVVRAIRYQRKGFPPQTLLTSLLDPVDYPAEELIGLYHERWELELGYAEIKTEMLEREESIRSKSPTAVAQEMWGILLAYNLVRLEMERVADEGPCQRAKTKHSVVPGAIGTMNDPTRLRPLRESMSTTN